MLEKQKRFRYLNVKIVKKGNIHTYHPDHLGSSSWITDQNGEAVQHLQYLPFGERYVDQRRVGWNAPYTFSGKERDQETQYIYFGARYYDSELSVWLSVDPLAYKYPSWNPYNYCMNNPMILVDPDGKAPWDPTNVKKARQFAKETGGRLSIYNTSTGKMASVGTSVDGVVTITGFAPTNDSWGQKIGNFFKKIENALTGGLFGTADNGQGQETRGGDGSNQKTDYEDFTGMAPVNVVTPGEIGRSYEESESQGLPKKEIQKYMHFERGTSGDDASAIFVPYFDKEDSAIRRNKYDKQGYEYKETVPSPPKPEE